MLFKASISPSLFTYGILFQMDLPVNKFSFQPINLFFAAQP
jgi:hypothetical protein